MISRNERGISSDKDPFISEDPQEVQNQVTLFEQSEHTQKITIDDLFRRTGLGIKIRFLLALTLIAIAPAILLVLLLGDPTGYEQQTTLGQVLWMQAHGQALSLQQELSQRQSAVANVSSQSTLPLILSGTMSVTDGSAILRAEQQSDASALHWLLVRNDGTISATGDSSQHLVGQPLTAAKDRSDTTDMNALLQQSLASPNKTVSVSNGNWLTMAQSLPGTGSKHAAVIATFSLAKLAQPLIVSTKDLQGSLIILTDKRQVLTSENTYAESGTIPASLPGNFPAVNADTSNPTVLANDPLTGKADLAVAATVSILQGQSLKYVVLAPQTTALASSNRVLFAGRNTPLLVLAIFVGVILIATWVALPIVRPIRRATREIAATTNEVRRLAQDAQQIAEDHVLGTTILSGVSKRFGSRRQIIIRDSNLIQQICVVLMPRLQQLLQQAQGTQNSQLVESIGQGISQIHQVSGSIASGLEKDVTLQQLDKTMGSVREISTQFENAGHRLNRGAENLDVAARSLL